MVRRLAWPGALGPQSDSDARERGRAREGHARTCVDVRWVGSWITGLRSVQVAWPFQGALPCSGSPAAGSFLSTSRAGTECCAALFLPAQERRETNGTAVDRSPRGVIPGPPTPVSPLSSTRTDLQAEWPAALVVRHVEVAGAVGCQWCARTSHMACHPTRQGRLMDEQTGDGECPRV